MRITADEKAATRKRILKAGKSLFQTKGFAVATTRDIARVAGIAAGTMFNYFSSKESVVVALAATALVKARRDFERHRRNNMALPEELFAHVASQLRQLRPLRKFIRPVLETALSPLLSRDADAGAMRANLSAQVADILIRHDKDPSANNLTIYWSLYLGILTHWSQDASRQQEDTLALLDQSMRMFAAWLA